MKKLYSIFLLSAASLSYASSNPGKLPEDFSFRKCDEGDRECLERRVSFMKQFETYKQQEVTHSIAHANQPTMLHIPSQDLVMTVVCSQTVSITSSADDHGTSITINRLR